MASNYNSLGFNLMTTGENAGTWGTNTNLNLNYLRDTFAYITVAMTTDRTLTIPDNSTGTYDGRAFIIECNGALGANRVLDIAATAGSGSSPGGSAAIYKPFIVFNNTSTAYTLTFKVTGATGFELTQGSTYLCYHNGTDIINTGLGSGDVTLTGTQTLTNKTLTEPKFANGGFIADTTGAETLVFGEVASPLNEVKITNAATGTAGPIIASQGQTDVNLQLRPAGTGKITVGTTAANATISSNGAHDLILETNEGSASGSITLTDAADGDITFINNGAGNVVFTDAAYNPETTVADGATLAWDVQEKPVAKVTLGDNRIVGLPTNPQAGQFISLLVIQDATGSRTLTWNAAFEFPAALTPPTLTTTGNLADLFVFRYHNAKWLQVGSTLALTVA